MDVDGSLTYVYTITVGRSVRSLSLSLSALSKSVGAKVAIIAAADSSAGAIRSLTAVPSVLVHLCPEYARLSAGGRRCQPWQIWLETAAERNGTIHGTGPALQPVSPVFPPPSPADVAIDACRISSFLKALLAASSLQELEPLDWFLPVSVVSSRHRAKQSNHRVWILGHNRLVSSPSASLRDTRPAAMFRLSSIMQFGD